MEKVRIIEILKEFGSSAYWYGENTGDYDLEEAKDFPFFQVAVNAIKDEK